MEETALVNVFDMLVELLTNIEITVNAAHEHARMQVLREINRNNEYRAFKAALFHHPEIIINFLHDRQTFLGGNMIITCDEFGYKSFATEKWMNGEPMWADKFVGKKYGDDVMLQVRARWQELLKNYPSKDISCKDVGLPVKGAVYKDIGHTWIHIGLVESIPEVLGWECSGKRLWEDFENETLKSANYH